jgi:hypothetical protein
MYPKAAVFLALLFPSPALAGLSAESVAVVVNGDSWASLTVANEYARLRHIPPGNFVVLSNLSSFDTMDINHFRDEVLAPVFAALNQRGLASQIDCITYSLDLPYSVTVNQDMAGRSSPQIIAGVAAANGLTFLHEWGLRKDCEYLRLDVNRYARRTLPLATGKSLTTEERAEYYRGMTLYDAKNYSEAAAVIGKLTGVKRSDPSISYSLACCQALAGKPNEAMTALSEAVSAGLRNPGQTTSDPDLKSLAERADFTKLIERMKSAEVHMQPPRGFCASYGWDEAGAPGDVGPHYMLSTMLGVASGRGNSVNEVLECLRRAAQADGSHPPGTIYFLKNGDVRSTTRDWAFPEAADRVKKLGIQCVTEDGVLPQARQDVAGALVGTAEFDWTACRSQILPGAICEHFTSCGGMLGERDGQTPCTDFVRAGAAGTSGAVTEPFALQEKFPNAFMYWHYASGCTLAEAFYQSVLGPYQLLVIGDPLCRPWGEAAAISLPDVKEAVKLRGSVSLRPHASGEAAIKEYVLYVDGQRVGKASKKQSGAWDTTEFSDGVHRLSVVAFHDDAIETRSRAELNVTVDNHGGKVQIEPPVSRSVPYGETILVNAACAGAADIDLLHLGRVVGSTRGEQGKIEVDTTKLGLGVATLHPVAHLTNQAASREIRGAPIDLEIVAPPALTPYSSAKKADLAKGLTLSIAGGEPIPITDTFSPDWLAKAGATEGQPFVLTGCFEVPKADLYQVQLQSNSRAEVMIDEARLVATTTGAWGYAPVQLLPGLHRLLVGGTASKDARLDLRLGVAGTAHPNESRFSHVVNAGQP